MDYSKETLTIPEIIDYNCIEMIVISDLPEKEQVLVNEFLDIYNSFNRLTSYNNGATSEELKKGDEIDSKFGGKIFKSEYLTTFQGFLMARQGFNGYVLGKNLETFYQRALIRFNSPDYELATDPLLGVMQGFSLALPETQMLESHKICVLALLGVIEDKERLNNYLNRTICKTE
jgi:hypothetical protein